MAKLELKIWFHKTCSVSNPKPDSLLVYNECFADKIPSYIEFRRLWIDFGEGWNV